MKVGLEVRRQFAVATAVLLCIISLTVEAGDGPLDADGRAEALLSRMNAAQGDLDYEGTLVYLHGQRLAALHITHRVENGVSRESLLALSGPIRAVARNDRGVTCMLPDSQPISVPSGTAGSSLLRSGPFDYDRIRRHYLLHELGASRVAGRDTDVVGLVPRDDYRYGYRFFIDRDSGLPLKIDLMDDRADPIEQVMFTTVAIVPRRASAPSAPRHVASSLQASAAQEAAAIDAAGWMLTAMPPGFAVIDQHGGPPEAPSLQHLMVSDGLASASVYIEPADGDGLEGATQMGAITAVGRRIGDHQATVVGEVPELTARMLLDGLRPPQR